MIPRPQPARRVSPAISQDIQEDIEHKISMGWMRRAPPDFVARFASPIVAVKQPGKSKRRGCGDCRVVNSLSHQHACPCNDTREVTAFFLEALLKIRSTQNGRRPAPPREAHRNWTSSK
jgi:hypothetical protein